MKYAVMTAVVLAVTGIASASPIGVYIDDDFDGTTLDAAVWTGSATVSGGKATVDGWGDPGRLTSIATVAPDAGQTVILTVTGLSCPDPWPYVLYFGLSNIRLNAGQWQGGVNDAYYDITLGSQKKSDVFSNLSANGDWTITWTPSRVVIASSALGTVFDTDTTTPDGGGTWIIPTAPAGFDALNYYQSSYVIDGITLEVVPEPVTLALLAIGSGLMLRRRA